MESQYIGAALAALAGLLLWALGWLVKISVWKGGADSTMSGLQQQIGNAERAREELRTRMTKIEDTKSACREDVLGAIGDLKGTVRVFDEKLDALVDRLEAHNGMARSNPGTPKLDEGE